jgi:uncharacterized protein YkwD
VTGTRVCLSTAEHPPKLEMVISGRRLGLLLAFAFVAALVLAAQGRADPLMAPRRACADPPVANLPLGKVFASAPAPGRFKPGHVLPAWWWRWAKYRLHAGRPAYRRPTAAPTRIPAWAWTALRRFEKRREASRTPALAAMVCLHEYAHRRSALPRFHVSRKLSEAAALKVRKMIACHQLGHTPCGIDNATYKRQVGFTGTWWGENAAYLSDVGGYSGVRATFNAWLDSPEHRFSITFHRYHELGIAAAHVSRLWPTAFSGVIWVADFGG